MLEKYKGGQPFIYEILNNSIINNKINHAYLFDVGAVNYGMDFALSFVKELICSKKGFNNKDCNNCVICERINNNNYPEIKIIEPEGLTIKKEQLLELQSEFSTKPVEGSKKIYIINEAEKLNKHAANSILKFLEEPEEEIVAILLTKNIYQMLDTIVSRCQVMTLLSDCKAEFEGLNFNSASEEDINEGFDLNKALDFIIELEKNKKEMLLYTNKKWHKYFNKKEDIYQALQIIISFYMDILNKMCGREKINCFQYNDDLSFILEKNNIFTIIKKVEIINNVKELLIHNINKNLLIDKLIIQISEV